jgi:hypothetical protein
MESLHQVLASLCSSFQPYFASLLYGPHIKNNKNAFDMILIEDRPILCQFLLNLREFGLHPGE